MDTIMALLKLYFKPTEGSSEKENKIKIMEKKIEGHISGAKFFINTKFQNYLVIVIIG
jgi:hypothetical protein